MKYLLTCKCGQCVKVEPGQAGQTVVCACGENLLVPTMLQVKALPVAPEESKAPHAKVHIPYKSVQKIFIVSAVFFALSYLLWWIEGDILFLISLTLGCSLSCISLALVVREATGSPPLAEDSTLRRTFFILGSALLFPSFFLAFFLYAWQPTPAHVTFKREVFTWGSEKKELFQNSTPISRDERRILWMTDEEIDRMLPMDLYFYFLTLEQPTFSYNFVQNYEAVKDTYRIWVTVNIILFLLSISSIVVSYFLPKQTVIVTGWSGSEW